MIALPPAVEAKLRIIAPNALRLAAGGAFFSHGAQKILGWFGGMGPNHGTVELMSRFGAAGIIEVTCGALLFVGLWTVPVAIIASGEMAVTYFWMHWSRTGHMWWWDNHGELPLLYSFIWLSFATFGPGTLSLDAWLAKRRSG